MNAHPIDLQGICDLQTHPPPIRTRVLAAVRDLANIAARGKRRVQGRFRSFIKNGFRHQNSKHRDQADCGTDEEEGAPSRHVVSRTECRASAGI